MVESVGLCPTSCPLGAEFEGWIVLTAPLNLTHFAGEIAMVVFEPPGQGQGSDGSDGGILSGAMLYAVAGAGALLCCCVVGALVYCRRKKRGQSPRKPNAGN